MRTNKEQPVNIPVSDGTSFGSVAGLIERALRTYGCDPENIFTQAGIDRGVSFDPDARIPITKAHALWKLSVEATGDSSFGLTVADQFQPAALYGLGFAWLASDTLRDAFDRFIRFSRLLNTFITVYLDDGKKTVDLVMLGPESWPDFVHAAGDMVMAIILRMCQITVGEHVVPLSVVLQRPYPPSPERFNTFFGAPVKYGASDNRLCFDPHLVNRPLMTGNPKLARINDQTVVDYLARFDRSDISMKVRAHIIEQLPSGSPNQEFVANALHMSLRTLQRKLKDEETTYKNLLDDTRRELATQYISEGNLSLGEISYLLGFAEPGSFGRAFRRWTGSTPAEFRETA